jgi:uncharacterized protein (TIRG00374 family)
VQTTGALPDAVVQPVTPVPTRSAGVDAVAHGAPPSPEPAAPESTAVEPAAPESTPADSTADDTATAPDVATTAPAAASPAPEGEPQLEHAEAESAEGEQTEATPVTTAHRRFRIPREVRITATLIVLVFVVEYFLLPEIAKARKNIGLLGKVNPLLLVLATGLEVLSLLSYAQLTHTVLSPGAPKRFRLFRVNMWSLAVSHVLPGGTAAGTAAGYRMLTDSGVPGSTAAFGMALQGIGSAVVLNVIFWLALVISIPLNGFNPLYGTAAIAGTLLLAAVGLSALLLTKGQHRAVDQLHRLATHIPFVNPDRVSALVEHIANRLELLLRDRRLLSRALLWAAANWLFDAASLWVFVAAFGHRVFPIDLLVAYGLANILAAIPLTPGGLGVVEATLIATLTGFGVSGRVAGVAVLTWRLVNFWLPIPGGAIAYLSLRFPGKAHREEHSHDVEAAGPAT